MNLLKMYEPSLDRIYGNNLTEIRQSFNVLLLSLDGLQTLFDTPATPSEIRSKFSMLIGCVYRHFEIEVRNMQRDEYSATESHIDKHAVFTGMVETFRLNFFENTREENLHEYRSVQRWLLHHLLMDDAHFATKGNLFVAPR